MAIRVRFPRLYKGWISASAKNLMVTRGELTASSARYICDYAKGQIIENSHLHDPTYIYDSSGLDEHIVNARRHRARPNTIRVARRPCHLDRMNIGVASDQGHHSVIDPS